MIATLTENKIEEIPIHHIAATPATQSRVAISEETARDYAEVIHRGGQLPPIVVFCDGTAKWLGDGFHRLMAYRQAGKRTIPAEVRPGSKRDAILFSIGSNQTHGLRRTIADKRRAIEMLLADSEWSQWSDREIARQAGVSHTFVSQLRNEINGRARSGRPPSGEAKSPSPILNGKHKVETNKVDANLPQKPSRRPCPHCGGSGWMEG